MRILLCDDDPIVTNQLTDYIREFFLTNQLELPEIAAYHAGAALLADQGACDLLFLDIEMPDSSGIDVGEKIKTRAPQAIIFIVTSYSRYLDDAMRIHVFRYLSKPIEKKRLFRNLQDAMKQYYEQETSVLMETKQGTVRLYIQDIIMVEALERNVVIHTRTGNFTGISGMRHYVSLLSYPCFFQSHRSFLVNLRHVSRFDRWTIYLYQDQFQAYLTRRRYTQFKSAYLQYFESTR